MWIWLTPLLLVISNAAMLAAWYGHLRWSGQNSTWTLGLVILVSWGIALVEYLLMIPANRFGFKEFGGPYSLVQLKVMQEVIHLGLFALMIALFFKSESLSWRHALAALFLIAAVALVYKNP
jgi:uncharacterized protein (DUF486 family)